MFARNLAILSYVLFLSCDDERSNRIQIANYPDNKKIAVSFTFDDGCPSVFTKVVPLFEQFGYKASFFIIPSVIPQEDWQRWKTLLRKGYEVGNHSMSHRDLTQLDSAQIAVEVIESLQLIKANLDTPIVSFAHPHHHTTPAIENVVLRHHSFSRLAPGFCKWYGWTSKTTWDFFSHDIKKAFKNKDWFVPAIHGVGDCWEPIDESLLKEALAYIHERRDEIFVDTFANIGRYKIEKENTMLDVIDKPNRKSITLRSTLDPDIYNFPLTIVINDYDFPEPFEVKDSSGNTIPTSKQGDDLLIQAAPGSSIEISW